MIMLNHSCYATKKPHEYVYFCLQLMFITARTALRHSPECRLDDKLLHEITRGSTYSILRSSTMETAGL